MIALDVALLALAVPVGMIAAYLALLAVFAFPRSIEEPRAIAPLRFDVVVPAHDEEAGIAATVKSVLSVDYPAELRRVIVVADNCLDETASHARGAGATVIVRDDRARVGKGYALDLAFARVRSDGIADAVVVVDADTIVSRNLLRAFAVRIAGGEEAIQADYGVRNPDASWRTRLMVVALALFHGVRSLGRERLGLSVGLRGNGMCFTRPLLARVPHRACSLVEDVEHGIALGESGVRVAFAHEAHVWGEMASGGEASRTQRRRWEQGRKSLARRAVPRLLRGAARRRSAMLLDLALDLVVPPFTRVVAVASVGFALALARTIVAPPSIFGHAPIVAWSIVVGALALYLLRGVALPGVGLRGVGALLYAPAYVVWKFGLALRGGGAERRWIRTAREGGRS